MLDLSDIGISTGAYAELPLAAALLRIAELAPAAEVFSYGRHSLARAGQRAGRRRRRPALQRARPVHALRVRHGLQRQAPRRPRACTGATWRSPPSSAPSSTSSTPICSRRPRPWNPKVAAALERSFEELRVLQDELGLAVAVENMPLSRHSHFTRPGDLDLRGLGLVLDAGHAALTGTLAEWLAEPQASLRHVHLHDNGGRGDGDRHRPLGSGVVDAGPVLAAARAAGATIALELTNEADVLASLEYLRANELLPLARQID